MLHYFTIHQRVFRHAVYRILFYLPLVLGSFWFGLRGAVSVSVAVAILYLPFGLYVFTALMLGHLSERERREQIARLEAERLAALGSMRMCK